MDKLKFRVFDKQQNKYVTKVTIEDEDGTKWDYYDFMIDTDGWLCAKRDDCSDFYVGSDSVQYMDMDRFVVEMNNGKEPNEPKSDKSSAH